MGSFQTSNNKIIFVAVTNRASFLCQVSLSPKAEKVLEESVQGEEKGDVMYFWARLDMDGGVSGSDDVLTFWSMCDILNGGGCRYVMLA